MKAFTTGPFTGRHITIIMVAFFAVVIAVNLLMARYATSTFGGVVVENSYVASQNFNKWLDEELVKARASRDGLREALKKIADVQKQNHETLSADEEIAKVVWVQEEAK